MHGGRGGRLEDLRGNGAGVPLGRFMAAAITTGEEMSCFFPKDDVTSAGILLHLFFLNILQAYIFRDWRVVSWVTSIPAFICVALYWVLPESPKWLLTAGLDRSCKICER